MAGIQGDRVIFASNEDASRATARQCASQAYLRAARGSMGKITHYAASHLVRLRVCSVTTIVARGRLTVVSMPLSGRE